MLKKTARLRPSIAKTDKNWYSEQEISLIKKSEFDKGVEHFKHAYLKDLAHNLNIVQSKASEFFTQAIDECEVDFKQIRLKITNLNSFELIFVMDEKQFSHEEVYRKIYNMGLDFIEANFDGVCVTFMYMPNNHQLNNSALMLDGFMFTYDPNRAAV